MTPSTFLSGFKIALASLLLACSAVIAADIPTFPEVASAPSVSERLAAGRAAIQSKNWKSALAELNHAARDDSKNADVQNLLGYSYRKQPEPNLPQAFVHYKRALELNPLHRGAHEYIGEAFLMDKKPEEAQKHLVALEKICGNKTCEEYKDLSKSIADYRARQK